MTLTGHVENGVIILDDPASLPEGTSVTIEVNEIKPDETSLTPRQGGWWKGRVHIAADFDELPEDYEQAFGMCDE